MKNTTIFFAIVILIALAGGFVFVKGNDNGVTGNVIAENPAILQGEVQQVILSQDKFNYKDVVVEANKPIAVSADSSVGGCLRSVVFNIDGKKYSKYLTTPEDVLELPALKEGAYTFTCSMGMGYGSMTAKKNIGN